MNLKKYLPYIILIMCIISIFIVNFTYISLGLAIFTLILCLLFSRKNIRLLLITIIISIATIITNGMILYRKTSSMDTDLFKGTNILIGSWNYNLENSSYIFNDDYSYIQYDDIKNKDNYCTGTYKYSYGGTGRDDKIIKQDDNYYYYDLTLNIEFCMVNNEKTTNYKKELLVFGINKNDYNDLIFMNIYENYAFKVTKVTE